MAYANSAINPLLYTFLGHNFKERLQESVKNFKRVLPAFTAIKKVTGFSFKGCKKVSEKFLMPMDLRINRRKNPKVKLF